MALNRRTVTFLFLNAGHLYDHLFMLLYPTVLLSIGREIEGRYGELLGLSVYGFIAFGAGALPAGWLGDRWSRRGMMIVFFIGLGASSIVTGLATGPVGIALGLFAIGVFASIYHPVGIALVAENARRLGREMGINGVYGNLGVALAAIIAGTLIELFGWRAAFIVPGVVAVLTGLVYALVTADASGRAEKQASHRPEGISHGEQMRVFAVLIVVTLFGGVVFNATTVGMPKILEERLGSLASTTAGVGAWAFAVFAVAAVAQVVVGTLIDRFPLKRIFVPLALSQVPALLLAATATHGMMVAAAVAIMLTVFGQIPITDTIVARYTTGAWRSRVYAVKYLLALGVAALAVRLVGDLHDWSGGFHAVFLALAGMAAMVIVGAVLMPGHRPRPVPA